MYLLLLGTTALSLVSFSFLGHMIGLGVPCTLSYFILFLSAGNNSPHFQINSCGNATRHPYAVVPLRKRCAE